MHLGMPECHKPFLGHCDLDLWPSFQELLCPEHISYIIWCRNPKFWVVIPLGMAEWCIQFWVILTLTLTSGFISRFFLLYYSYLSSNVSCARPIPLGAFVTCLWHFLLINIFWRDASISFNVHRRVKHHKIQVKFDKGGHPQYFDWEMTLFWLRFWLNCGLWSITLKYHKIQVARRVRPTPAFCLSYDPFNLNWAKGSWVS